MRDLVKGFGKVKLDHVNLTFTFHLTRDGLECSNKLGFTRSFRPESMLAVMKNFMVVVESHDAAVDNMFHDFRNN